MVDEQKITDIDFIEHKIDWEGWPDALEWLSGMDFGDKELNQLIFDAAESYNTLEKYRRQIEDRVDELRNKDE